jgi:hypothetical protein
MTDNEGSWLLELPDSCLMAVLQRTADDLGLQSLFSAARAHSKLHETATVALRSISVTNLHWQQAHSLLLYLAQHGQHVDSLALQEDQKWAKPVFHLQLPAKVQPGSLQLPGFQIQLQPGKTCRGVLGPAAWKVLQQLRIADCVVLDGQAGLAAALMQLPALEHLSLVRPRVFQSAFVDRTHKLTVMTAGVLPQLQHLTYLELDSVDSMQAESWQAYMQGLELLTHLQDLRLAPDWADQQHCFTASMLSGAHQLTRLQVSRHQFEASALAGKTALQHLDLHNCGLTAGTAGLAQLLSHLQHMQALTFLDLSNGCLYS